MRRLRLRTPSTESLFVATLVLFGFRLGAHAIGDNSMFLHLRTGIDMARGTGIPRVDPYSFTARGEPFVVQSWLAEWTYGWLYRIGGMDLVILEQAVLCALVAWLVVRLARAGTPLRTAAAGAIAVGAGAAYWTPRPLLFGLLCLALLVTAVERRWRPWSLVPVVWLWVNTHGSFPLGLAFLAAVIVGEWLDDRAARPPSLPYLATFAVGLLAGAVNPLGPKLLTFAAAVGDKREIFKEVTEWRSPNFQEPAGVFTLAFLTFGLLVLFRARVAWRHVLPVAGFVAMGLLAMRNLSPAAIVLAPAVGAALSPAGGAVAGRDVGRLNRAFAALLAVGFAVFALSAVTGEELDLRDYPVAAVRYLERNDLVGGDQRVAHSDVVGDYLILRLGRRANVFYDDRFDMYPVAVSRDADALINTSARAAGVLDKWKIDTVLWKASSPLVPWLEATGDWHRVYRKAGWVVLRRR